MDKIEDVTVEPLQDAKFVKPFRLRYKQNGVPKTWEVISVHPSVSIIIFNVDQKKLVFVKQFRPAVYFSTHSKEERELLLHKQCSSSHKTGAETKEASSAADACGSESRSTQTQSSHSCRSLPTLPGGCGITLELCAGIVDKNVELKQVAKEEVLEECGYEVKLEDLEEVITFRSGVGASGDRQTMFYAEVRDAGKTGTGGGLASEGELIEVVELSIGEVRQLLQQQDVQASSSLLFAVLWFLTNKAPLYE